MIIMMSVIMILMMKVMSVEEHALIRRREALAAEAAEASHHHHHHLYIYHCQQHCHCHFHHTHHNDHQNHHHNQAGPSVSLARGPDGNSEAGTEVERLEEEEVREVEGETEDFTSILLPVDSKERRVVLRRVSRKPLLLIWQRKPASSTVSQVGVSEIDVSEKEECRELRSSRQVLTLSSNLYC